MPKQITKWITEDGKEFDSELFALRHETKVQSEKLKELNYLRKKFDKDDCSSYGSSGGGGHD